jgi:hypothetical protein
MARRSRKNDLKKYQRWVAEGRGAARGAQYRPFLSVRDVPSLGNVNRVKGWKTGRVHQFLSNLELSFFYLLEWADAVSDINEQFPLDLAETQAIAEQLGFKHPTVPALQLPNVMTSDFKVTFARGLREDFRVYSVKPSNHLTERTLAKLEIERRYWARRNVPWTIVTERDIDVTRARNIQWLHPYRELPPGLLPNTLPMGKFENILRDLVITGGALSAAALDFDKQLGLPEGTGLTLARHFLATKTWRADMNQPINPSQPLVLLNVPPEF